MGIGEKVFITNGGIADVFVVFAQVDGNKFSGFIIEKGMGVIRHILLEYQLLVNLIHQNVD